MKYIVIVPDGMADQPLKELNNRTPLQVARTTNMDYLAQNGMIGQVQTIPRGMQPGSEVGNMSILGYNPGVYLSGRAPLEAASMGITLADDEVAFRCNLVTVNGPVMGDYSAGHISSREAKVLIEHLNDQLRSGQVAFYPGKSYRHIMIIQARQPEQYITIKTTPPHDIMGRKINAYLPTGTRAQMLQKLMEQSRSLLAHHEINNVRVDLKENPANMIWLWGQGGPIKLPSYREKYGLEGAIISAVDLVQGLGRVAGLEVIDVPNITGYYDTNYLGKARYALKALQSKDFVYVHIEAPDEAGHNGDVQEKINAIERIDKDVIGTVLNHFNQQDDVRLMVVSDHPTPLALRTHTSDPVGFVMYGSRIPQQGADRFDETTVKDRMFIDSGEDLMQTFLKKYL